MGCAAVPLCVGDEIGLCTSWEGSVSTLECPPSDTWNYTWNLLAIGEQTRIDLHSWYVSIFAVLEQGWHYSVFSYCQQILWKDKKRFPLGFHWRPKPLKMDHKYKRLSSFYKHYTNVNKILHLLGTIFSHGFGALFIAAGRTFHFHDNWANSSRIMWYDQTLQNSHKMDLEIV